MSFIVCGEQRWSSALVGGPMSTCDVHHFLGSAIHQQRSGLRRSQQEVAAEASLCEVNVSLECRVAERTAELQPTNMSLALRMGNEAPTPFVDSPE